MMDNIKSATGSIKGVVKKYNDQSFEFTPFGKGEPVYEEQQKFKNGVTYAKTRGTSGKRVVRIPLDGDTPDVFAACVQKLNEAFPEQPFDEKLRARTYLLEGPDIKVAYDKKNKKLSVRIDVAVTNSVRLQKTFFNLFNQINLCLATNKTIFPRVS